MGIDEYFEVCVWLFVYLWFVFDFGDIFVFKVGYVG